LRPISQSDGGRDTHQMPTMAIADSSSHPAI